MTACTIVVNNHNYGRYLRRCVDSSLAQTIPVEVVVVDDGSTDDSLEILRSYGSDVKLVAQPNGGQASAVNSGVAVATSPIVLMLDSDDWCFATRAERVVEVLTDSDGWLRHGMQLYDERSGPGADIQIEQRSPRIDIDRVGITPGATSAMAFTRELLNHIGPIPTEPFRTFADGYLKISAAYLGRCTTIPDVLGARSRHHDQVTSRIRGTREQVASRIGLRHVLAQKAASLSSDHRVAAGDAWWQQKAALHATCLNGSYPARLRKLARYALTLREADIGVIRKLGFLTRESMLACAPRDLFLRLWWLTVDGRPLLLSPTT